MFPRVVYHKDYKFDADFHYGKEEHKQNQLSKMVKSQADLDRLGPNWVDHPFFKAKAAVKPKPAPVVEEDPVEEEVEEEVSPAPESDDGNPYEDDEKSAKKKKSWGKK